MFQVPVHCIYLVELYPNYPSITLIGTFVDQNKYITNPLCNFGGRGSCLFSLSLSRLTTWRKYLRCDVIYNYSITTLELDRLDDTLQILSKITTVQW